MISLNELQILISETFFSGNSDVAGIMILIAVMALIFVCTSRKGAFVGFLLMIPVTYVFSSLQVIPDSMTVLLIIVAALGLALTSRTIAGRI